MIQKIISVKDPRLRERSKNVLEIDKKIKSVIQNLKDTLNIQKDPIGVGLAAPQIGKSLRIFAVKPKNITSIIINPEVLFTEKDKTPLEEEKLMEGCLSLPNYYGPLKRPGLTKLNYLDENGNKITKIFQGFDSQIIQHELDHLQGILFIDRLIEQKKPLYELINGEWEKVELI